MEKIIQLQVVESEEKYEKVRLSDCWSRSLRGRYGL